MRRRRGPLPQGCAGGIVQVKAQSLKTATALGMCDSSPCTEKSVGRGLERTAEAKCRRFSTASHRVRESRDAFCCTIAKWRVASSPFLLCLSRGGKDPQSGIVTGCFTHVSIYYKVFVRKIMTRHSAQSVSWKRQTDSSQHSLSIPCQKRMCLQKGCSSIRYEEVPCLCCLIAR